MKKDTKFILAYIASSILVLSTVIHYAHKNLKPNSPLPPINFLSQSEFEWRMIQFSKVHHDKEAVLKFQRDMRNLKIKHGVFTLHKDWQNNKFGSLKISDDLFVEFITTEPFNVRWVEPSSYLKFIHISSPICASENSDRLCNHISVIAEPRILDKKKVQMGWISKDPINRVTFIYE